METAPTTSPADLEERLLNCVAASNIAEIHRIYAVQIIFQNTIGDQDSGAITLCPQTGKWVVYIKKRGLDIELIDFMQGMIRLILLGNKEHRCAGNNMPKLDVMRRVATKFVLTRRSLVYDLYFDTRRSYR